MHRINHLNDAIFLLQQLTTELQKHREEINNDDILALQKETRSKIKQLKEQLDILFPTIRAVQPAESVKG